MSEPSRSEQDRSTRPGVALGVVVPAFNTTVEDEYAELRPPGVRHYVSRIRMPDTALTTDEEQRDVVTSAGGDLSGALRSVAGARPDAIALGISIPAFWDGPEGSDRLRRHCEDVAGRPVALASEALRQALAGLPAGQRAGLVTPYQPEANRRVASFVEACGVQVASVVSLSPPRSFEISLVSSQRLEEAMRSVLTDGVSVIVQVGTNLRTPAGIADRVGAPVLAVNPLVYALALRLASPSQLLTHP